MTMHRREQALKGLPGPKHPLIFGMMMDLVCRRDPHRYATELAERYGPIFKFRLLIFHVSAAAMRALHHDTAIGPLRVHAVLPRHQGSTRSSTAAILPWSVKDVASLLGMEQCVRNFPSSCVQAVCITDPVLATQVLQSKVVDKLRFPYSFLDPVSPLAGRCPGGPTPAKPC